MKASRPSRPVKKPKANLSRDSRLDEIVAVDRDGTPLTASPKLYAAVDRMRAGHHRTAKSVKDFLRQVGLGK